MIRNLEQILKLKLQHIAHWSVYSKSTESCFSVHYYGIDSMQIRSSLSIHVL